ncbi:MAG TPA: hypothetical protein VLL08_03455 [Kineosporiaceae bacterium]|nr:hypothetical protein [Kineosporiaceae bacterium]
MADPWNRRGAWAILLVVLLVLLLLLSRCSGSSGTTRVGAVPNSAGPAEPAPESTTTRSNEPDSDPGVGSEPDSGNQTLTVDGRPLLPLPAADGVGPNGDLTLLTGKQATARGVRVLTVPADEGFWIGTGRSNRVWVQLTGPPPESPYQVRPGDRVSFSARITPNGRNFARRVGVTRAEGAGTLAAQGQHISVPKQALTLAHP